MARWTGVISLSDLTFGPIEVQVSGFGIGPFDPVKVGPLAQLCLGLVWYLCPYHLPREEVTLEDPQESQLPI